MKETKPKKRAAEDISEEIRVLQKRVMHLENAIYDLCILIEKGSREISDRFCEE